MFNVDIHADDYGLSVHNSERMIELIKAGKLNSISIICLMDSFEECMKLLNDAWDSFDKKPLVSIHIDLVDGVALTDRFSHKSWGELFLTSFLLGRKRADVINILTDEIEAQMSKVIKYLPENVDYRVDSHMHTHMIPIVSDAMWKAIDRMEREISFVRVAREPIMPFLSEVKLWPSYRLVNIIKNILLNILSPRMEKECRKRSINYGLLWGLIMSDGMDYHRVNRLYDKLCNYSKRKNKVLEILLHPGIVLQSESISSEQVDCISKFYYSCNRDKEYMTIERGINGIFTK